MSNYIENWLVLGPISNPFHQTPHSQGDGHPVAAEIIRDIDDSSLSPAALTASLDGAPADGTAVSYYSALYPKAGHIWRSLRFQITDWQDSVQVGDNVHKLAGEGFADKHHALAFFLVYITSPDERQVKLLIRSDDSLRVWANGAEIEGLRYEGERELTAAESSAAVTLRKGTNIVMAAVAETHVEWGFSARLDPDEGLAVSTVKPAQGLPERTETEIRRSLGEIGNAYTLFEPDQVLTHDQLNSVSNYLDDQNRLGRLNLSGAGIAQGLRLTPTTDGIKVGKGIGLTTDGDILYFAADKPFTHYRSYDRSRPRYPRFFENRSTEGKMYPLFELLESGAADQPGVYPLKQFPALAGRGRKVEEMLVLLFMESYVTDWDRCSAADCDNLGQECRHIQRLLMIDPGDAGLLKDDAGLVPAGDLLVPLSEVVPQRVLLNTGITDYEHLLQQWGTICDSLFRSVKRAVTGLPGILEKVAAAVPALHPTAWAAMLDAIDRKRSTLHLQYYLEFLNDLAEICNRIGDLLDGELPCCCPSPDAFPKHLVLGTVTGAGYRTGFYPSPFTGHGRERIEQVKALVARLEAMLGTFNPASSAPIRITPTAAAMPLEDRAIPFYYRSNATYSIETAWTRPSRRSALQSGRRFEIDDKTGEARGTNSENFAIGSCPFFRIEGHLGRQVAEVEERLERAAVKYALPFAVRAIKVGSEPIHIHRRRPVRYGDLHRMHYLLRQDVSQQLEEMADFSRKITGTPVVAVASETVAPVEAAAVTSLTVGAGERPTLNMLHLSEESRSELDKAAAAHQPLIAEKTTAVVAKVGKGRYSGYKQAGEWQGELNKAVEEAAWLKTKTADTLKTGIVTPIDTIISNTQFKWIGWLDRIIETKESAEDQKLLLHNFVRHVHGLEQGCGVCRGGTFILLYRVDAGGEKIVIGDAMLSYHYLEPGEDEQDEPVLEKVTRPGVITHDGMTLTEPLDRTVNLKVAEEVLKRKSEVKDEYLATFRDYVSIADKTMTGYNKSVDTATTIVSTEISKTEKATKEALDNLPNVAESERAAKEKEVVDNYAAAVKFLASPVMMDSRAITSMVQMTEKMKAVTDVENRKAIENSLNSLEDSPMKTLLKKKMGFK